MSRPPARSPLHPGDILVSPTRGGPGYHIQRVIDPRPEHWSVWHVDFASTEAEAFAVAARARAEVTIWLQTDTEKRRARRVRPDELPVRSETQTPAANKPD